MAGTWVGVYSSTDNGDSWSAEPGGALWVNALAWHDATIFAVGDSENTERIARSADLGKTWVIVYEGAPYSVTFSSVTACGSTVIVGGISYPPSMYRSSDDGQTWTSIPTILPYPISMVTRGATIFAGNYGDVYRSTDVGETWSSVSPGWLGSVTYLAMGDSQLYASTTQGVYRRPFSEIMTSVSLSPDIMPRGFSLWQNYPNPFNPETKIIFSLPEESDLAIRIYDLVGREVRTLFQGRRAPGEYQVTWTADMIPSGVYFCRLEATSSGSHVKTFRQVRKMVLLR
jgi:hypothetical protein